MFFSFRLTPVFLFIFIFLQDRTYSKFFFIHASIQKNPHILDFLTAFSFCCVQTDPAEKKNLRLPAYWNTKKWGFLTI